jgi:WD40 repeat protein
MTSPRVCGDPSNRITTLAFGPDGKRLFCWTAKMWWMEQDIPALEIWDADAGRQILTLTGHQDPGIRLAISANGKQVLTGACDGTARRG